MKKLILVLLVIASVNNAIAQKVRYNLLFKPEQTKLTETQKNEIAELIENIADGELITIYPLTNDTIFQRLVFAKNAKIQALEIAKYAESIGFKTMGTPSNFPSSYKGLSVSVSLKYYKQQEEPTLAGSMLKNHYPDKPSQFFVIDPTKDTLITGNEGTKLFFGAGSLMSKEKVQIELKEFYTMSDYLKSDLPTISNGEMIQTGGVIYLNATQESNSKQQVKINPDKGVDVDFTIGKADPDMQVFIKDTRSPNSMNWVLPPQTKIIWEMTETTLDTKGNIISEKKFNSKAEWEAHLKAEENEKKQEIERQEARVKFQSKLNIVNLGFINCDKFFNEPMIQYEIAIDAKIKADYYLVYKDVRGVMCAQIENNKAVFGSVPSNKQAILIAVAIIDKQAYYFESPITANSKIFPKVELKPVDESYLNKQLALLK
ncbi:MAG: hypothetical protein WCK02_13560 [Bacteroidota bacterium]